MLRCVNMLEEFEGGTIRIDGEEIGFSTQNGRRQRKSEKEIARQRALTGMAFQQFNLFPHMTALENVTLGLTLVRRMGRDERGRWARHGSTALASWPARTTIPPSSRAASSSVWRSRAPSP